MQAASVDMVVDASRRHSAKAAFKEHATEHVLKGVGAWTEKSRIDSCADSRQEDMNLSVQHGTRKVEYPYHNYRALVLNL